MCGNIQIVYVYNQFVWCDKWTQFDPIARWFPVDHPFMIPPQHLTLCTRTYISRVNDELPPSKCLIASPTASLGKYV